jgi:hypothetical protein
MTTEEFELARALYAESWVMQPMDDSNINSEDLQTEFILRFDPNLFKAKMAEKLPHISIREESTEPES